MTAAAGDDHRGVPSLGDARAASPVAIACFDPDSVCTDASELFGELFGRPSGASLIGISLEELLGGDPPPAYEAARSATAPLLDAEVVIVTADGYERSLLTRWFPLLGESLPPGCVGLVAMDVTERRQRQEQHIALQRLTEAFARAVTPEVVADVVIQTVLDSVDALGGALFIPDEQGTRLHAIRSRYPATGAPMLDVDLDADLPVALAVREQRAVWIGDMSELRLRFPSLASLAPTVQWGAHAALPLVSGSQVHGGLVISWSEPREFDDDNDERQYLLTIANQCAQALQRAALFQSERSAREHTERVADHVLRVERITGVLLGANEPDEVIDRFLEDGLREIGATDGVVLEVDPLAQVLTPLGDRSITEWDDRTVALDAPGPLAEAVRTRQSVLLENLAQVKAYVGDAASSLTNEQAWAAVPLVAYGQTLGVAGIRFDGARQFDADDRAFLERVGRRLAEALDRSRLYAHQRDAREQAEAAARWLRSVQSMAAALARSATRREVARALREHLHPATRADFSLVAALSSDGRSLDVLTGTSTFAMPTEQLGASVERAVRDSILRGRSIELDSAADVRAVFPGLVDSDIESFALLPIRAGRAVTGVIGMGWAKPGGISPESRRLLAIAVSLGGAAFERATAYDVEHHIADTLQRQLLTEPEAELAGVAWAARYSPGSSELTAGGDWYDVIGLPGDRLSLIVGDIVGHGVVAAAAMGQLRSATRALAVREDPVGVLEALDSYVTTTRQGHLSSIAYVVLDPAQGVAEYAIAGHPPPLVRTPDGTVVFIEDTRGPLLGLAKPGTRTSVRHRIEPGSTIVLYTDGLVERRGEALDAGLARLGYLVAESPLAMHPEGLCDGLLQRLAEGGTAPDDITLLAVEFEPLGKQLRHTFPARLEMLRVIRGEVRAWLGANGLEPSDVTDIVLACDEACANAIEHGSHGQATDTIDLVLRADGDELVVSVTDSGAWPDDDRIARRAHGLQIMEALMDHVEIVSDDGGTTVTMLFRRRRASLD